MADLTTYTFYTGTYYGDTVSETDFPKWLSKATDELMFLTFNNITDDSLVTWSDKIQKATCALIDTMCKLADAENQITAGDYAGNIKTRSSGGESVTYVDVSTVYTKALTDDTIKNALFYDAIRPYLTGTGLLYAGY